MMDDNPIVTGVYSNLSNVERRNREPMVAQRKKQAEIRKQRSKNLILEERSSCCGQNNAAERNRKAKLNQKSNNWKKQA